jgi:hypothetical protein
MAHARSRRGVNNCGALVVVARTDAHLTSDRFWTGGKPMARREIGAMDMRTAASIALVVFTCYSAWLTSIIFCATNGHRPLMIAGATFFPVGIVHGFGIWFGGW